MRKEEIFFEELKLIKMKYDILKSNEEKFNIFSILREPSDEVELHSKFITELLKEKKFLKKFFKMLEVEIEEEYTHKVFKEYYAKENGRIDILIEIYFPQGRKVIVIENKIYAEDQPKQLERYKKAMKKIGYKDEEITIVYLTLQGNEPQKESRGNLKEEEITLLSYKNDMSDWIDSCIEEVALQPAIRETLVQYKKLIGGLTNKGDKNMIEDLKKLILSDSKYTTMAFNIPEVLTEIKIELQLKFWESLEEKMRSIVEEFGIVEVEELGYPNLKTIEDYYKKSKMNKWYGLKYKIKDYLDGKQLFFKIEIENNIYYGLPRFERNSEYKLLNLEKETIEEELKDIFPNELVWWYGWKYFYLDTSQSETINFRNMSRNLIEILSNEKKLNELTTRLAEEIKEDLIKLKEAQII